MSQHIIAARNPSTHSVIVGWDRPLRYFFAMVQKEGAYLDDPNADYEYELDPLAQYKSVEEMAQAIDPWVEVPVAVAERLKREALGLEETNVQIDHTATDAPAP